MIKTISGGAPVVASVLASMFGAGTSAQDAVQWPVEDGGERALVCS